MGAKRGTFDVVTLICTIDDKMTELSTAPLPFPGYSDSRHFQCKANISIETISLVVKLRNGLTYNVALPALEDTA